MRKKCVWQRGDEGIKYHVRHQSPHKLDGKLRIFIPVIKLEFINKRELERAHKKSFLPHFPLAVVYADRTEFSPDEY